MQVGVITFAMKGATNFASGFPNYSAYVIVAIIPWTYFLTGLLDSTASILMMYNVIRKVYLPREIIPLASIASNFIHFLISWLVFFVYWWLIRRGPILWNTLAWFPYLLVCEFLLVTGLGLFLAALNVFYEDVKYMVTVFLNLLLFALPIMYPADYMSHRSFARMFHGMLFRIYMLNPITAIITGFRKTLLEPPSSAWIGGGAIRQAPGDLIFTGIVCVAIFFGGYAYFNTRKWRFTERP